MHKLLTIAVCALGLTANAQLVTNNSIELVWTQAVDDAMRVAWKTDTYCRTNGIMPYAAVEPPITYKQFLTVQVSDQVTQKISEFSAKYQQLQEQVMLAALRDIQATNPAMFKRIWGIALKGE